MINDVYELATILDPELQRRIAGLAGNQARIALLAIACGGELDDALDIAESYPPVD